LFHTAPLPPESPRMIRVLLLLLLLVAVAAIAWRLLRGALGPPPAQAPPKFEPTARCARCGTHVPRTELDAAGACARCRATPG
jgi:hypothetical protein